MSGECMLVHRGIVTTIIFLLLPVAAAAQPDYVEGPFAVQIEPSQVSFYVDGPPGVYNADMPVNVSVRSGFAEWSLHCQASPLIEQDQGLAIPASRIYLASGLADAFAAETVVSLEQPVIVGDGSFTGPEFVPAGVLQFCLQTEWADAPGTYLGQITLTFLATP